MTHRSRHLEEALRECAERGVGGSGDPWPAVRERLGTRLAGEEGRSTIVRSGRSRRPWHRRLILRTRAGWVLAVLLLGLFATAAYAASGLLVVSDLTIKEATLQSGTDGDEVIVRAVVTGKAKVPMCYLFQGSGIRESTWSDVELTESVDLANETVYTFHEDQNPTGKAVDPDRTPLFASCWSGVGSDRSDEAHVEGTAEGKITSAYRERDFIRKDMAYREITPPVSTLSFAGKTMRGEYGRYCWSPGLRDEAGTLWCWDKEENGGVPEKDKTLVVPAGSTVLFDFGGAVKPDSVLAGAYPLVYGRLTGQAATGLRVREDGRIELPEDIPAGEYSLAIWVSGSKGEAMYSYRIAIEDGPGENG